MELEPLQTDRSEMEKFSWLFVVVFQGDGAKMQSADVWHEK